MIRLLFWFLVFLWLVTLLRRALSWMLRDSASAPSRSQKAAGEGDGQSGAAKRLVRDPVCGTHVAEERALTMRNGSEVVHFCSPECRDQYAVSAKKFAANQ
jgi:YHS domain-containing protein